MEKKQIQKLHELSGLIGHFIRYWGFRKIHGEIWTVVYLSQSALSGVEIGEYLQVSKALVSPALKELEDEGLLFQVPSENSKTKRYQAEEDVAKVIRAVLLRREKPMIDKILEKFCALQVQNDLSHGLDKKRLEKVGEMIQSAQAGLTMVLDTDLLWK